MEKIYTVTAKQAEGDDPFEFVMSDATIDRMDDVIDPKGWDLKNFKGNPIALFNHNPFMPIGRWANVRLDKDRLVGKLEMAEQGTSPRIDEIRSLIRQGILRAVSVGFQAKEKKEREGSKKGGYVFTKMELLETSLVSIPANPNALQVARSLGVSQDTMSLVFGEHATRAATASMPDSNRRTERSTNMDPLAKRIQDTQNDLVQLKDKLAEHIKTDPEAGAEETHVTITEELTKKIETTERSLASLQAAEKSLASTTRVDTAGSSSAVALRTVPATPMKTIKGRDRVLRSLVGIVHSHATRGRVSPLEAIAMRYGEDGKIDDAQKIITDVVARAASAPATTGTSGWASNLVETTFVDFMELLMPASVYPGLAARGLRLNFGRSGLISIPTRLATPTLAGSFVLEGNPIPVRQGAFESKTLTPKKMAVISTFTREIAEHSTPSIEQLIRDAIQEDTSVALDTVLLDATAASTTRPAGIRNGVTVITATAGGGFAALVGDLKALIAALITASNGNLRAPVWIMNPIQALSISVTQNAGGDFPFAAEINAGRFQGYPLILSSTVTAGMVILVDAADFVSVLGDTPRFDMSDQATLHMEDTTPLAIGTAGSPATVAAPARSLFQTDSMALRMIMDVNWMLRRTGIVAWTQAVTW